MSEKCNIFLYLNDAEHRHHQKCLDLVSALLAFGNIFLGAQTFDHLTHFVLATLVAIVVLAALQAKNQPRKVSKLD